MDMAVVAKRKIIAKFVTASMPRNCKATMVAATIKAMAIKNSLLGIVVLLGKEASVDESLVLAMGAIRSI